MKLVSWNVNGLRACLEKGFWESVEALDGDVVCLQEIKLSEGQYTGGTGPYRPYWNYAEKKGYSGTAVLTRRTPENVTLGIGCPEADREGRTVTLEFGDFYLVNCYVPNSQKELARLDFRMEWEDHMREYLMALDAKKPVVYCGDLNVAHEEIDLKNPASNHMSAGFTDRERAAMTRLLASGFIDSFRVLNPTLTGAYSWWSYIGHARSRNAGWRIDYFLLSERLRPRLLNAGIHSDIYGSDHCPVSVELAEG